MDLSKKDLEEKLGFMISEEKYFEIKNLEYFPLTRVRTDLTFKKFHHLFVLGRAPSQRQSNGNLISKWWCICDCPEHNIINVRVNNLTSNTTKSCGCQNRESAKKNLKKAVEACRLDLTNKQFGNWRVLYPTEKRIGNRVGWMCECQCKNHTRKILPANYLQAGRTLSCGCMSESKGSQRIKYILQNYNYEAEKCFPSCKFPDTQASARFDFYLPEQNILIEYDGEQHFKELDRNFFKDTLQKRQEHDAYKNQWCLNNNISLYRIPYWECENINALEDILQDKFLVKEETS